MALKYDVPNKALMRELKDVSSTATSLKEAIQSTNRLPNGFPETAINEIIVSLQQLPSGSAEGCFQPLKYAQDRLSAIRRTYILNREAADEWEKTIDLEVDVPPLRRSDNLDIPWQALFSNVGTALDEYREQAGEPTDYPFALEQSKTYPQGEIISTTVAQSITAEKNLKTVQDQSRQLLDMDNIQAQLFLRALRDAEIANRITRAELQFNSIVKRWFENLSINLKKYPQLLRSSANAIKSGSGITRSLYNRFNELLTDIGNFGFEQLDKTADMFDEISKKLENPEPKIHISNGVQKNESDSEGGNLQQPATKDAENSNLTTLNKRNIVSALSTLEDQLFESGATITVSHNMNEFSLKRFEARGIKVSPLFDDNINKFDDSNAFWVQCLSSDNELVALGACRKDFIAKSFEDWVPRGVIRLSEKGSLI